MRTRESIKIAVRAIVGNGLRSALTMLGILIGVGAVIMLVAVGNGSSVAVQRQIQSLGTNTLIVNRQAGFGPAARRPVAHRHAQPPHRPHHEGRRRPARQIRQP